MLKLNRSNSKDVLELITEHDEDTATATDQRTKPAETENDAEIVATGDAEEGIEEPEPEDADPQNADADESPRQPRSRRLLQRALVGLGALALVTAISLAGFFGWQVKEQKDIDAAGQAALQTARSYAVTLTSVDNQKLDENFKQVLEGATGEFKDMYSQSAAQLRQLLIDNKAVSRGTVVDAAIKSATKTKVEVLVFVDQSISNSVNPEPRIDRSRVAITMDLVDNHWLASKVDIK
ncbi:hypothetical protein [[Mycobacterium] nativiensis]|uniref:Mce protein n=1 Tax=[Mycobacterium] nativiensis TaxID=2855503 RepID=A0ABU5XVQ8_9MYCO|nr:hypothetical protein [Mycolicibacter sp. MYC340]MEB3031827.1 hypothetical protein [Mycolicibacter sp. MYC340]